MQSLKEYEKKDLILSVMTLEDLNKLEQENILEARIWLMQKNVLAKSDIIDKAFLLNLHKRMFGHIWKWAGQYRKVNKDIGVPYYEIAIELEQLISYANFWLKNKSYDIPNIAIMFHYRLVKIHLFSNGNARHARLVADAIIAKYGYPPLSWGNNSIFTQSNDLRKNYIEALHEADKGNDEPLLIFAKS